MLTCVTSAVSLMSLSTAPKRNSSGFVLRVGTGWSEWNCDNVSKASVADGRFAGSLLQHFSRNSQTRAWIPWEGR